MAGQNESTEPSLIFMPFLQKSEAKPNFFLFGLARIALLCYNK